MPPQANAPLKRSTAQIAIIDTKHRPAALEVMTPSPSALPHAAAGPLGRTRRAEPKIATPNLNMRKFDTKRSAASAIT